MKRTRDKALAQKYTKMRCIICGKQGEGDHIRSFGSGGEDCVENMWCLCRKHHTEKHLMGFKTFVEEYGYLCAILKEKGWVFDKFNEKYIRLTKKGWDDE